MAQMINGRWVKKALFRQPGSPYWYGRIRDTRTGRVHAMSTRETSARKADRALLEFIGELEAKEKHQVTPGGTPLGDALTEWLRHKDVRDNTLAAYRADVAFYVRSFPGKLVHEIDVSDVEELLTKLRKEGKSARTRMKHLVALRGFFRWAIRRRYCTVNPCEGLKVGRPTKNEKVPLTPEQARALLDACRKNTVLTVSDGRRRDWRQTFRPPPYLHVAVAIAVYTGLRRKNVFGLRWRDVDLGARKIALSGEMMKNHESHEVPIHPALAALLGRLLQDKSRVEPDAPVVGAEIAVATKGLRGACKRAGVPEIGWHALRHSFASWLAASSACSFNCLRELLGHKPMTVTAIYTHSTWEERVKAVDSLPPLLAEAAGEESRTAGS